MLMMNRIYLLFSFAYRLLFGDMSFAKPLQPEISGLWTDKCISGPVSDSQNIASLVPLHIVIIITC